MKHTVVHHLRAFPWIYPKADINLLYLITTKKYEQFT